MNIPKLLDAQNRSNIPMKSPQFPKFPVQLSVRLTTNLQLRDMFSPDGTLKKLIWHMSHKKKKKQALRIPLYWLFYRDPYNGWI